MAAGCFPFRSPTFQDGFNRPVWGGGSAPFRSGRSGRITCSDSHFIGGTVASGVGAGLP